MKTLVIWENVPDNLELYLLDLDEKYLKCNGKLINSADNSEEIDNLLGELYNVIAECDFIYRSGKSQDVPTLSGDFKILRTGFIL